MKPQNETIIPIMTKPSYSLVSSVRTPNINPGDSVEIALYLTGIGNISKSKLDITHSHPHVISPKNSGRVRVNIVVLENRDLGHIPVVGDGTYTENPLRKEGTVINPLGLFIYEPEFEQISYMLEELGVADIGGRSAQGLPPEISYPRILGELAYQGGEPPILVELNTAGPPRIRDYISLTEQEVAKPGDYSVIFTLTYGSDNETFQSQTYATYHVNTWIERNAGILRVIGIAIPALALIPFALLKTVFKNSTFFVKSIIPYPFLIFMASVILFSTIVVLYRSKFS